MKNENDIPAFMRAFRTAELMPRFKSTSRSTILLIMLSAVICAAQETKNPNPNKPRKPLTADEINSYFGVTTYPFTMSIKLKSEYWDSRKPLVIYVIFKNTADRSVFIDLKSSFQFNGWLNNDPKKLDYRIVWRGEGTNFDSTKEDYTEIPIGEELSVTLTSLRVEGRPVIPNSEVPWRKHKPGKYTLFLNYSCGAGPKFPGKWSGQAVSGQVTLRVR